MLMRTKYCTLQLLKDEVLKFHKVFFEKLGSFREVVNKVHDKDAS